MIRRTRRVNGLFSRRAFLKFCQFRSTAAISTLTSWQIGFRLNPASSEQTFLRLSVDARILAVGLRHVYHFCTNSMCAVLQSMAAGYYGYARSVGPM